MPSDLEADATANVAALGLTFKKQSVISAEADPLILDPIELASSIFQRDRASLSQGGLDLLTGALLVKLIRENSRRDAYPNCEMNSTVHIVKAGYQI